MKKIMFNDRFGLTEAVLNGSKTQTRRVVKIPTTFNGVEVFGFRKMTNSLGEWYTELYDEDERPIDCSYLKHQYQVGEVVAIAQSYEVAGVEWYTAAEAHQKGFYGGLPGKRNKMFVKAELMPHKIRITNVRIERLQDISEDDCLKEGISACELGFYGYYDKKCARCNTITAKKAYSRLIDGISGKGTWDSNPFVWVYDFELVK